jgi:hypothetical protein
MEIARSIELGKFDVVTEAPDETAPTLGVVIPQFIELHAKPNNQRLEAHPKRIGQIRWIERQAP